MSLRSRAIIQDNPEFVVLIYCVRRNLSICNLAEKTVDASYQNAFVVRYTVAENTGVDALQLALSYDADAFTLVSVVTDDTTSLGAAEVNDANIVFDNVSKNNATGTPVYTATGDTLITATFTVKNTATRASAYNFGITYQLWL